MAVAGCDRRTTTAASEPAGDLAQRGRPRRASRWSRGSARRAASTPRPIYDRLSPGVVTILSLFDGGPSLLDEGGEGGQGSGFVLDGDGYIATNAHVVTTDRRRRRPRAPTRSSSSSPTATACRREIVGHDPNADVALLKVDPDGLSLTPLALGESQRSPVGRAGRRDRQPVRRAAVALGRRDLGARPRHRVAHALRDRRRDPDRRRHQPAATPAGRCSTPTGRVIGINAQIKSQSGGGEGVGFAVPVDTVRRSLRRAARQGPRRLRLPGRRDAHASTRSSPSGSTSTWRPGRSCRRSWTAARPTTPGSRPGDGRDRRSRARTTSPRAAT